MNKFVEQSKDMMSKVSKTITKPFRKEKIDIREELDGKSIKEVLALTRHGRNPLDKNLPTIDVNDYTKMFGKFVSVKNANFKVGHGVIHGFIGPNGSGKTTCIKALIGAYVPTSGTMSINGHKSGTEAANKLIGYIPERASFPKYLNTIEYLTAMGELSGIPPKEAKLKSAQILAALGLSIHAKRKPIGFSSGMQKKILLAQSLLTDPSILILDEPAANLDPTARKELFDQLIDLRNEGKTILISSHILSELERLVDEVTFIYYGDVIYSGTTDVFTKGRSDVYIKSTHNDLLSKWLMKEGYDVAGDLLTEVEVRSMEREAADKLLKQISAMKEWSILSFRSNDLQSVYDKLVREAEMKNRGQQSLDGVKAIAMNKTSEGKSIEEQLETFEETIEEIENRDVIIGAVYEDGSAPASVLDEIETEVRPIEDPNGPEVQYPEEEYVADGTEDLSDDQKIEIASHYTEKHESKAKVKKELEEAGSIKVTKPAKKGGKK